VQARIEAIRRTGGDAFNEFQLPQAVLALKQGVGRLIRDFDDRGGVSAHDHWDAAWDNAGNLYAIDNYDGIWRVYSPPGSNQAATVAVPLIQVNEGPLAQPRLGPPTYDGSFVHFTLFGEPNVTYIIQISSDLQTWTSVATNSSVFANRDNLFTAGQFGRIRIPGSELYKAILIPDAALVTDQSRKIVLTVNNDDVVVPKIVRPGPASDGLRIIRDGLLPTDRIVINGVMRARPGTKVAPHPGTIEPEPETD